jgi:hypothetical protein
VHEILGEMESEEDDVYHIFIDSPEPNIISERILQMRIPVG